jgi:hypothetical protein
MKRRDVDIAVSGPPEHPRLTAKLSKTWTAGCDRLETSDFAAEGMARQEHVS